MNKSKKLQIFLLFLLFLAAFFIRIFNLKVNETFISSDEVRTILTAIDAFKIFTPNLNESLLHLFRFFSFAWGPTFIFLSFINISILTFLKISLTETTLVFYNILIGSFSPIVLYFLTKEIYKKFKIAYLAAIFLAIFPIHVNFSRSLGGCSMISALLLMLVLLFFIKYIKTQKRKFAIFSSISLGFYMGATSQFLGIFPILLIIALIFQQKRGFSILKSFFNRYFILPASLIFFPIFVSWLYYWIFRNDITLGVIGHMFSREKLIKFHPEFFINTYLNVGLALAILFIVVLIYALIRIYYSWRTNKSLNPELLLLCWFLIYSFPWLFLVEPGNVSYMHYLSGTIPLLILASGCFYMLRKSLLKKNYLFCDFALSIIVFLTLFYAFDAAYDLDLFKINDLHHYGRSIPNFGTKTAGYYIREHTSETARIFSEFGIPPAIYFFHRDMVVDPILFWSINSSSNKDKLNFFREHKEKTDYIILTSQTIKIFNQDLRGFYKIVSVQSQSKEVAAIYSRNKQTLKNMAVEKYDKLFDEKYGNWKSLYVDCYFCLDKPILNIENKKKI